MSLSHWRSKLRPGLRCLVGPSGARVRVRVTVVVVGWFGLVVVLLPRQVASQEQKVGWGLWVVFATLLVLYCAGVQRP